MASLETWSDLGSRGTGSLDEKTVRFGKVLKNVINKLHFLQKFPSFNGVTAPACRFQTEKLDNFRGDWESRPTTARCQVTPSKAADKVEALVTSPTKMPSLVSSESVRMHINEYQSIPDCENHVIQCFYMHPWCSMGSVLVHLNLAFLPLKRPRTRAHLLQPRRSRAWPGAEQVNGALSVAALTGIWIKMGSELSTKLLSLQRDMERMKESTDIELFSTILQTASTCGWRTSHPDPKDLCNANSNGGPLWDSVQVPLQDWTDSPARELGRIDSLNKKKRYRGVDAILEVSTANHWTKYDKRIKRSTTPSIQNGVFDVSDASTWCECSLTNSPRCSSVLQSFVQETAGTSRSTWAQRLYPNYIHFHQVSSPRNILPFDAVLFIRSPWVVKKAARIVKRTTQEWHVEWHQIPHLSNV